MLKFCKLLSDWAIKPSVCWCDVKNKKTLAFNLRQFFDTYQYYLHFYADYV